MLPACADPLERPPYTATALERLSCMTNIHLSSGLESVWKAWIQEDDYTQPGKIFYSVLGLIVE